jgi:Protein of unknown function (DUF2541)
MKKIAAVAALACLTLACATVPAAADWSLLGTREVRDRTDRDTIVVEGHRTFTKVRFCAYRRPVNFKDVDIHFRNGGHQDVSVAVLIRPGACTRAIDLEGGARDISSITFLYETMSPGRHRATVRAFGE